ncbi:Tyrosyl-tRNA synthetase [Hordeum vulgare]|nr:Tyrosyl-tRNA synthetase [Hordeum vulgare]
MQDNTPKFEFTPIPLCGIEDAESTMTLFEDDEMTTTSREALKEHALEASEKVASNDHASIFGGVSEMVEHGIFTSTTIAFEDELRELGQHIMSESAFTTITIYDELPKFPCEENHNPPALECN